MIGQLKHLDVWGWLYGLGAAVVGGGSSAVTAAFSTAVLDPDKFGVGSSNELKLILMTFGISGVISLFTYLKQSPLPKVIEEERS